ncbi:hypothetical protein AVEN_88247-1 [Araneus ventricosus]|uniref:Uncharacterized protein n=1 Tax=Araneus ventricosus TaxID=182803 RepID=A0A4Y2IN72_ARAVE|nr:hypothetical protein AVEN_88247-1 [Araneus ventricosus]
MLRVRQPRAYSPYGCLNLLKLLLGSSFHWDVLIFRLDASFECNSERTEGTRRECFSATVNELKVRVENASSHSEMEYRTDDVLATKGSHIGQLPRTQTKLKASFCIVSKIFLPIVVYKEV